MERRESTLSTAGRMVTGGGRSTTPPSGGKTSGAKTVGAVIYIVTQNDILLLPWRGNFMWVVTQPFPSHGGEILCGGHKISPL